MFMWNRHISYYATCIMDMSHVMPHMEQPCMWIFHAIHTHEHACNYAWWLLLLYACLSSTSSSMNVLYFYQFLWSTDMCIYTSNYIMDIVKIVHEYYTVLTSKRLGEASLYLLAACAPLTFVGIVIPANYKVTASIT